MKQAVENQDWDNIKDLDAQRVKILEAENKVHPYSTVYSSEKRIELESELRNLDASLQSFVNKKHREIVNDRRTFNARQNAKKNYISTHSLNREY